VNDSHVENDSLTNNSIDSSTGFSFRIVDVRQPLTDGNVSNSLSSVNHLELDGSDSMNGSLDVGGNDIVDGSTAIWDTSNTRVGTGLVDGVSLDNGGVVNSSHLGSDSVGSDEIATGAVTGKELGNGGVVNESHIAVGGVNSTNINLGNGIEDDGSGNIRVNGGAIAGNVLTEGTSAHEVDVSIGKGLEDNSGTLRVNPAGIAGNGLEEGSTTLLDIATGGVGSNEIAVDGVNSTNVKLGNHLTGDASGNIDVSVSGDFSLGNNNLTNADATVHNDVTNNNAGESCSPEGAIVYNGTHHLACGKSDGTNVVWENIYQ